MTIGGRELVAIHPADLDRLDACRRQLGARNATSARLRQQLRDAQLRLAQIEAILTHAGPDDCVCATLATLLGEQPTSPRHHPGTQTDSPVSAA